MTDIAAIKAELRTLLEEAQTKPPWTWVATGPGEGDIALGGAEDPDGEFAILAPHVCPSCAERGASCMAPSQSDAALIVAAVNALPALLADTPSVEPAGLREAVREFFDAEAAYLRHVSTKEPVPYPAPPDTPPPDFGPWDRMQEAKARLGSLIGYAALSPDPAEPVAPDKEGNG